MTKMNLLASFIFLCSHSLTAHDVFAQDAAPPAAANVPQKDAAKTVSDDGYTPEANEIKAAVESLFSSATAAQAAGGGVDMTSHKTLKEAATFYSNLHGTCVSAQSTASGLCREKTSPDLQKTLNDVNVVASMLTGMAVKDACSTFAKMAKIGQAGLTAYTAACSTARAACEASCSTVKTNLERLLNVPTAALGCGAMGPPVPESAEACNALQTQVQNFNALRPKAVKDNTVQDIKSIALKKSACTYEYANMILSAGAGIASMMNAFKEGQSCDENSDGTGTPTVATAADKCKDPANATLPECICLANPRTPGCANSYQKVGENSASSIGTGSTDKSNLGASRDLSSINLGGSEMGQGSRSENSDSGGMAGAPVGSGSTGLGGGGNLGSGSGGNRGEAAKKGLDANILGGAGGGGGGGGSWGSGGGSASSKYRSYLPGGDKDPNKGLAGQQAWKNEVTGQGGKSNWDKIKERYRDNKNTLLNN